MPNRTRPIREAARQHRATEIADLRHPDPELHSALSDRKTFPFEESGEVITSAQGTCSHDFLPSFEHDTKWWWRSQKKGFISAHNAPPQSLARR